MGEKKTLFKVKVKCPHCKKLIEVKQVRETVKEAVKGEFKDNTVAEKSEQKTLNE